MLLSSGNYWSMSVKVFQFILLSDEEVDKFLDGGYPIAVVPKLYKAQNINLYWDSRTTRSNFGPRNILWEPLSCVLFFMLPKMSLIFEMKVSNLMEKIKDSDEVEVCKTNLIKFKKWA